MDKKQTGEKTFLQKRNERMIIDDFDRMNEETKIFENRGTIYIENTRRATYCLPILFGKRVNVKILNDIRKEKRK